MTSSYGTYSALLALCERNPSVTGEFPSQKPVARSFDVFFDLRHRAHYDVILMTRNIMKYTEYSTKYAHVFIEPYLLISADYLPIIFRVTSPALRQSYDCQYTDEVQMK